MIKNYLISLFDTALAVTAGMGLGVFIVTKNLGFSLSEINPKALALNWADWILFLLIAAGLALAEFGGKLLANRKEGNE